MMMLKNSITIGKRSIFSLKIYLGVKRIRIHVLRFKIYRVRIVFCKRKSSPILAYFIKVKNNFICDILNDYRDTVYE